METRSKSKGTAGRILPVFLMAIAAAAPLDADPPDLDSSSDRFPTPEKAIERVVDRIRAGDLPGVLEACAVGEQASGYDFAAFSKRLSAMTPILQLAPSGRGLYDEMNRLQIASQIARQVKFFVYSLLGTEKADGSTVVLPFEDQEKTSERIDAFIRSVDPSRLAGLEIVKIGGAGWEQSAPRLKASWADQAKPFGAAQYTERLVLYRLEGRTWIGGFGLMRYGKGWKVTALSSAFSGQSALGALEPGSPEDFEYAVAPFPP